jgi:K+-transporting ATPase KdpF subunit
MRLTVYDGKQREIVMFEPVFGLLLALALGGYLLVALLYPEWF